MMKRKQIQALILSAAIFTSGCSNYISTDPAPSVPLKRPVVGKLQGIDFETIKKEVLTFPVNNKSCVDCHGSYRKYSAVFSERGDMLQRMTDSNPARRMPKNRPALPDEKIELFQAWMDNGAPEFVNPPATNPEPSPTPTPTPTPPAQELTPNFASIQALIFERSCVRCHQPPNPKRRLNLKDRMNLDQKRDVFFDFEKPESSYFIERLQSPDDPMPPLEAPEPSVKPEEIQVIIEWIRRGLPD